MRHLRLLTVCVLAVLAASSFAQRKIVLGKLGQATRATPIYAAMNSASRVYYRVPAYEYLVVTNSRSSKWLKVLLKNGTWGYIASTQVAKLPYEVTANAPKTSSRVSPTLTSRSASAVANYSLNFLGTPYVWGGNDPNRGIDCSGFVKQMYGTIGVSLPRTAAEQALVGKPITRLEDLRSGDRLYFWEAKRNKIGHTGIYLGKGYFVHSSRGKGGVDTDFLNPKWLKILVAARR